MKKKDDPGYVTIRDVAVQAGTSIATVSYVLNDSKNRYISEELRIKVLDAASSLNYIKSGLASSLKGKQRGVIAVLTPQYVNPFFMSIFIAIEKIASEYGYVLATCNTFDDPEHERQVLERVITLRPDGYLIIPTIEGASNMEYLIKHNQPFVIIERPLAGKEDYHFITSDNYEIGYRITKYLTDRGHRRIGFLYWDTQIANMRGRLNGYCDALKEAGILIDPAIIKKGDITPETGMVLTEELLREEGITAIIYGQYVLAEGGIHQLRIQKKRIPDDISVAMVGNPTWTHMGEVEITRIAQAGEEIGREAAHVLLEQLDGQFSPGEYVRKTIESKLFVGESVKDLTIRYTKGT